MDPVHAGTPAVLSGWPGQCVPRALAAYRRHPRLVAGRDGSPCCALLEGEALKVLEDLLPHEWRDWRAVQDELSRRFGQRIHKEGTCKELSGWQQEKLGPYVAEILTHQSYPNFPAEVYPLGVKALTPLRTCEALRAGFADDCATRG